MECSINQHSLIIIQFYMIKGQERMSISHPLMNIRSHAPVPCQRKSSKKLNQKLTLFKKALRWLNLSLKAKKCQNIMIFIKFTQKTSQPSNINKIKSSWLMFGPHGVDLVKSPCSIINKCWPKMRINGKIRSELLPSVLMTQKNKLLSESIPKDGTKSST